MPENSIHLISITIALISAVIGPILVYWVTQIIEKYNKKVTRTNHIHAYEENQELNAILDEISTYPGVRKAVLIKNTNGGGIPKLGNPIHSSIISPPKWVSTWNNQLVDKQFADLTLKVLQKGKFAFNKDDLEVNTFYHTLLSTQDVIYSYWEELLITPKSYNFIAVDFYLNEEDILDEVKNRIRIKINEIRNLFNNSLTINI